MLIILLDSISLFTSIIAVIIITVNWNQVKGHEVKIFLIGLLTVTWFYSFSLWMEWTGITQILDKYEDFAGALIPMFWAFVFYSYIQEGTNLDLQKNETDLRITLNSIAEGVISTNNHGIITRMNPVAESLTGWTFEKAKGKHVTEIFKIVTTQTGKRLTDPISKVLSTGKILGLANDTKLISKNGTEYQITDSAAPIKHSNGTIIGAVFVFRDITEEYRLRTTIAENKERMELIINGAALGTWDWDITKNAIKYNKHWTQMLGYSPNEMKPVIESWKNLLHQGDKTDVINKLNNHLAGKTQTYEAEYRLLHKSGDWIWVLDRGRVINRDANEKPLRACGTILDISKRKQAEEILKRDEKKLKELVEQQTTTLFSAQKELQRAKRLSDVGTLATIVAHELRNPLAAINLARYNIEKKAKTPDIEKHLKNIEKKIFESEKIIENLLFYSKLRPPLYEKTRPFDIIQECIQQICKNSKIPANISSSINLIKDLVIEADSHQLKEVLLNIIYNAYDAIEKSKGLIEIYADISRSSLTITVRDNGCGIETKDLEKIFTPFFSTKAKGTGLGLTVCQQILQLHAGTIAVESKKNEGTTVSLSIPLFKPTNNLKHRSSD